MGKEPRILELVVLLTIISSGTSKPSSRSSNSRPLPVPVWRTSELHLDRNGKCTEEDLNASFRLLKRLPGSEFQECYQCSCLKKEAVGTGKLEVPKCEPVKIEMCLDLQFGKQSIHLAPLKLLYTEQIMGGLDAEGKCRLEDVGKLVYKLREGVRCMECYCWDLSLLRRDMMTDNPNSNNNGEEPSCIVVPMKECLKVRSRLPNNDSTSTTAVPIFHLPSVLSLPPGLKGDEEEEGGVVYPAASSAGDETENEEPPPVSGGPDTTTTTTTTTTEQPSEAGVVITIGTDPTTTTTESTTTTTTESTTTTTESTTTESTTTESTTTTTPTTTTTTMTTTTSMKPSVGEDVGHVDPSIIHICNYCNVYVQGQGQGLVRSSETYSGPLPPLLMTKNSSFNSSSSLPSRSRNQTFPVYKKPPVVVHNHTQQRRHHRTPDEESESSVGIGKRAPRSLPTFFKSFN